MKTIEDYFTYVRQLMHSRLRIDGATGRCPTRSVSLHGILLLERPRNIVALELLVQQQALLAQQFQ